MALLRHLHAWGANYQEPAVPLTEKDVLQQRSPPLLPRASCSCCHASPSATA